MGADEMVVEILPDGTLKVTTDEVSGANHMSAEQFLKHVAGLLGGEVTSTRRKEARTHARGGAHHHHHEHA